MSSEFHLYAGRWIAVIHDSVVGQGGTPEQATQAAAIARPKETPEIIYVPTNIPLTFPEIFSYVCEFIPNNIQKFLVGGAIRDTLLGKHVHDYDIILGQNSLKLAREIADQFNGAYFPLDKERGTARVILKEEQRDTRIYFDFAVLQGECLEDDLRKRDFTINAMAMNLADPDKLLDPLGGAADLINRKLRICANNSFIGDPIRVLRAVRLAASYRLKILPETKQLMKESVPLMETISSERVRDELFKIFAGPQAANSILALDVIGALPYLLPELLALKNIPQSAPHIKDVWRHTLDTLKYLEKVLSIIGFRMKVEQGQKLTEEFLFDGTTANVPYNILYPCKSLLGKYREKISEHLDTILGGDRTVRSILFFAALYHDIAKPEKQAVDEAGKIHFIGHDRVGGKHIENRGNLLKLSNSEINRLSTIVVEHMRPTLLARSEDGPSSRAIFRYFRASGDAGIDIGLLSLADLLATYGPTIPQERWERQLEVVDQLMQAYWEMPEKKVRPKPLITGNELLADFNLEPGPLIGRLLLLISEEQVEGNLNTREEALRFVKNYLDKDIPSTNR